jgi:tetratricopeptide (TPR) repeat protein
VRSGGRHDRASSPPRSQKAQKALLAGVDHHRQGHLERARVHYERVLRDQPDHPDALHLLGLVALQSGDRGRARELIGRAIARSPNHASFHNSLASVLMEENRADEAEASLRQALVLDPFYPEAHNNLGNALQQLGRLDEALESYARALGFRKDYAEAYYNRGRALQALHRLEEAEASFRQAVTLRADYVKAIRSLGDILAELGRTAEAEVQLQRALELSPRDAETLAAIASFRERQSELSLALQLCEEALVQDPSNLKATLVAARCQRRQGRAAEGLARLDGLDVRGLDGDSRAHVLFERAALCDRLGDCGAAFAAYAEANRLAAETPAWQRIDATAFPRTIERLSQRFTADWVASWTPAVPAPEPAPVFLIGFPRSGTTLLEQILDAHPALSAMEEKPAIDRVKQRLGAMSGGYPDALAALSEADIVSLRQTYFAEVATCLGGLPSATLVDKLPLNIIDAGLIHRIFPNARMLLALRHPADVVLSGFMQAFKPNAAMVHFSTVEDTARFYRMVMELWQTYRRVLALTVLTTRYEDLVADMEAETRRILTFLGISWEDSVLGYANRAKARAIATPSYHQVVQPIYRRSVARWRHYRPFLAEALAILAPLIAELGYALDEGDA